jgi:dUTP pyrophosphatase
LSEIAIKIKRLRTNVRLPEYANAGDVGMDIFSPQGFTLAPSDSIVVSCGFSLDIPSGWELQVRSKSGLASKGIVVANSPGTIDPNYKNLEVGVILKNISNSIHQFWEGNKIAQLVLAPVFKASWEVVDEIEFDTDRTGGFGSTGE